MTEATAPQPVHPDYPILREEWSSQLSGSKDSRSDVEQLDYLTGEFFRAFRSASTEPERFAQLKAMFQPDAVITKVAEGEVQRMTVDQFIAPRADLLTSGRLLDFTEWEDTATTTIFGDIAARWLRYSKNGTLDGAPYGGSGFKSMQFIRVEGLWRISSILWEDEKG